MTKLRHLDLGHNSFTGTVPSSLGNLSDLRTLDLSDNQLVGPLPAELQNLTKLYRLDIDNNLFGQISNNKSSLVSQKTQLENNRQIPDELAGLIQMDTLYLGGNKLQFNDIEAIFSWDNYSDFKDFIYYPQDSIGLSKIIETTEGDNIELSIDNYYPGHSDTYQWYKNEALLSGETNVSLTITDLQPADADTYYCKVTNPVANELVLTSRKIKLNVHEKENTNTPVQEFNALKTFYETLNGNGWANQLNWLDTINGTVNDWFGITMEDRHVRKIDLSGNGLKGELPDIFSAFDSLSHLDISNNMLHGNLPLFSSTKSGLSETARQHLNYLNISNNNYLFSDLEPVATELLAIDTFIYSPQQMISVPIDTSIYTNDNLTIQIENYIPTEQDLQSWYKNDQLTSVSDPFFSITNASLQDSGIYHMEVTNPVFPDLTLKSAPYKLSVMVPVEIEEIQLANIKIYPNPAEKRVFIDTQYKKVNLMLFDITGTKILDKKKFYTGWLDIEQFPKGIYIFRMEINDTALNKKVVFK